MYPKKFLYNSQTFSVSKLEAWADKIGLMLYKLPGSPANHYQASISISRSNCKKCSEEDITRLGAFDKLVWTSLKQLGIETK